MPPHVVLINQKLSGHWEITYANFDQDPDHLIRIVKFDKCKKSGFIIPKITSTKVITESIANTFQINFVCDLCSCECAIIKSLYELN